MEQIERKLIFLPVHVSQENDYAYSSDSTVMQ